MLNVRMLHDCLQWIDKVEAHKLSVLRLVKMFEVTFF